MDASATQSQAVIAVLDSWDLSTKEIGLLLGFENISPRQLERYRRGEVFPEEEDLRKRVAHIVGIAQALQTYFPKNSYMGKTWLRTPHRRFHNQAPLATMLERQLTGLVMVRCELDCAFSWDYSQKQMS